MGSAPALISALLRVADPVRSKRSLENA